MSRDPRYEDPGFVRTANTITAALRDSSVKHGMAWIGVTDLYHLAEDLITAGATIAPAATDGQE